MSSHIPEDFGSKWANSDLILDTVNANGRELHTSKHTLASLSSHFYTLFSSSDWKDSDVLYVDHDYEVVREVLRIVYLMGPSYGKGSAKPRSPKELHQLCIFADKCEFPMIKELCQEELAAQPGLESLRVSFRCGLHETTVKLLDSVDLATVNSFLKSIAEEKDLYFTPNEVDVMMKKTNLLPDPVFLFKGVFGSTLAGWNAEMQPYIPKDFGTSWAMSDMVLNTLNADRKQLHVSKQVLATHSPYFQAMFYGSEWSERDSSTLDLDDDYEVVKEALCILYHVGRSYGTLKLYCPEEIFQLYLFADKRDFPMIRNMCKDELVAQPSLESLRVAVLLDLQDITITFLENFDATKIYTLVKKTIDEEGVRFDGKVVKIIMDKAEKAMKMAEEEKKAQAKDNDAPPENVPRFVDFGGFRPPGPAPLFGGFLNAAHRPAVLQPRQFAFARRPVIPQRAPLFPPHNN